MLSKAQIKHIQSLHRNKFRQQHQQYVAEGSKIVLDILASNHQVAEVYATNAWHEEHAEQLFSKQIAPHHVDLQEIKKITALKSPPDVIALVNIPKVQTPVSLRSEKLYLALDTIQDPGNMGTIIRTADWFGIDTIFSSSGCVDHFNPKVVQASMGSIARVKVCHTSLVELIRNNRDIPVLATVMDGTSLYEYNWTGGGLLLIGNEGQGLSDVLLGMATERISIPRFGEAESLNAAMATGIILSHYRAAN